MARLVAAESAHGWSVKSKGPNNFGPIHILKNNQDGGASGLSAYSHYTSSSDSGFRSACTELLNNKLYMQQMWEEDEDTTTSSPYVIKGTRK